MLCGVLKMMVSASIAVAVTSSSADTTRWRSTATAAAAPPPPISRRLPAVLTGGATTTATVATTAQSTTSGLRYRGASGLTRSGWPPTPTVENITEEETEETTSTEEVDWSATYYNETSSTPSSGESNVTEAACDDWQAPHHPLFQTANIFFAAAFLLPHSFRLCMLVVRATLAIGFLLFTLWAGILVCAPDIFAWNLTFAFINATHVIYLACTSMPPRISPELQDLYMKVFHPLKMDKRVFTELVKDAEVLTLEEGAHYAVEDVSAADERLAILINGKVKVTCEDTQLHFILPNEFLDSPEWEACPANSDELFQVTVTAVEPSQYLCWQRTKLQQTLRNRPFLDAVIYNLIGKDITHKLYSLNEQINPFHRSKQQTANTDFYWRQHFPRSLSMDVVHTGATGHVRSHLWRMHSRRASSANSDSLGSSPARASRYSHLSDPGPFRSPLRLLPPPPVIVSGSSSVVDEGEEDEDEGDQEDQETASRSSVRSFGRSRDCSVSGSESAYVTAASPAPAANPAPLSLYATPRQRTPSTPTPTTASSSLREAASGVTCYGAVAHTSLLPELLPRLTAPLPAQPPLNNTSSQHPHFSPSFASLQSSLHVAFETPV